MTKGKAIDGIKADLAVDGSSVALTPAAPEGGADGDLFRAFESDVEAFAGHAIAPPVRRGPGRPAGSPDRSTATMRKLLALKGYRDPLEFLASIYSADTRDLAAKIAGKSDPSIEMATDAFKLQVRAAEAAAPYLHRKMPLDVNHTGDGQGRPLIVIGDLGGGVIHAGAAGTMSVFDLLTDQEVSMVEAEADDGMSHEGRSHGSEKR